MSKKKILSVDEIIDEAKKREKAFHDRDLLYDTYLSYYFGRQQRGSNELPMLASNAQGRPLLRQIGEAALSTKRAYSTRRLAPVIDDYTALVGRMPTVRVDAPDASEQAEIKAEKQTKYLYSTYELCDMDRQQALSGFFLSGLGDSVYVASPEPDEQRPVWEVISPRNCYPSFFRGYKRFQVYDVIIGYRLDPDTIERDYGVKPHSDKNEDLICLTYISPYQRTVLVGFKRPIIAADAEWDLGFCPVSWAHNKLTEGGGWNQYGNSDIAQALDQQDFLDFLANLLADGLVYRTYPIIGIKNPMNVGELSVGPDAPPVPMQQDGDIVVREVQGDIQSAMHLMQSTLQDINATTGTSSVRQEGQMKSSITTGRAVSAVQGPQSTRIELKQQVLGAAITRMNEYTFAMQEKAPHLGNAELEIHGRYKGTTFREKFIPKQDIDGWYRTTASWDDLVGMNTQQKVAAAYEGLMAKLWDDVHAMEMVGVDDPIEMRKRIETMLISQARMQQQVQSIVEGSTGGGPQQGPGAGAPPTPNSANPQGGGQPPAPQMIARPVGMAGAQPTPPPGGQPQGATKEGISKVLQKVVDKLKGTVYAVGDLAMEGKAVRPELTVTNPQDYNLVLQVVRPIAPTVKVRRVPEDKLPDEAQRLI